MVLHPLHSDLTFYWLHVTYTDSLAFPARQYSSIDGLPVSVCVCGFAAQPEPSGHLVKRGCFMLKGHTHVRLLLKNSAPPSWFTPSANTNQSFPHIIPQASLLVLPFFLFCFSPHLFTRWYSWETSEWQWETSWGRGARREKSAPVLLSGRSLWKEILPCHKESSIFCASEALGAFSCRGCTGPPRKKEEKKNPTPVVAFPPRFSPLSLFSLCYSSVPEFIFLKKRREILQKDNRSVSTTLLKVSCHTHTDLPPIGKLLSGTKDCHGNHTTSCSECSQDKATLYHAVLGPTHQVSLFRTHLTTSNVLRLLPSWEIKNLLEVVSLTIWADSVLVIREVLSSVPAIHPVNPL